LGEKINREDKLSNDFINSVKKLLDSIEKEFEFVREKHEIEGDNFSCPYFKEIAEARTKVNIFLNELKK